MSVSGTEVIERIARTPRLLLALDFDGTLSPHEDDPMAARMLPAARDALERLAPSRGTTVALVSGRSLADLRIIAEHGDDSPLLLSGSHGAETWIPGTGAIPDESGADVARRDELFDRAERLVAGLDHVWIEPKTFGFAVHTRQADAMTARRANDAVDALMAAESPGWRRRAGRNVVEFASRQEGKDTAVRALRERAGATAVLFAGDDVTDEDALRSLGEDDVGVHVGSGETAATVTVSDTAAFAALLHRLADERAAAQE